MKTSLLQFTAVFLLGILLGLSSCIEKREIVPPPPAPPAPTELEDYYVIGEKTMTKHDYTLKLLAKENLKVGLNKIAVQVYKTGTTIREEGARVLFWPIFTTATTTLGCPVPETSYSSEYVTHFAEIMFTDPSGPLGSWRLEIGVNEPQGVTANDDTANFDIAVKENPLKKYFGFMYRQSQWDPPQYYFVAAREPHQPVVGMNPFHVLVHKREGPFWYPAATTLKLELTPVSWSRGDTSINNTHPQFLYNSLYEGEVNFPENGKWVVGLKVYNRDEELLYDGGYFEYDVR